MWSLWHAYDRIEDSSLEDDVEASRRFREDPLIQVTINGEARSFQAEPLITEVLESLNVRPDAVAVEVNRVIVLRSRHSDHRLQSGDVVEVVTFVGGG